MTYFRSVITSNKLLISDYASASQNVLLAFCVVSATFRFRSVFSFSGSLLMMLFAFFYSHQHPIFFFVNASANQSFNRQDRHSSRELQVYLCISNQCLIMISEFWPLETRILVMIISY